MCISVCQLVCVCNTSVSGPHSYQKRALDSLEVEVREIVSHCVGAENRT